MFGRRSDDRISARMLFILSFVTKGEYSHA